MLFKQGEVLTLREMGEEFLKFVEDFDDITQSWEIVDDRLDSFEGATIRIPLESYKGDLKKKILYNKSDNFFSNIVLANKRTYEPDIRKLLQEALPNSEVSEVEKDLETLLVYLMDLRAEDRPEMILTGGFDPDKDTHKPLQEFCKKNNIELKMFYFPKVVESVKIEKAFKGGCLSTLQEPRYEYNPKHIPHKDYRKSYKVYGTTNRVQHGQRGYDKYYMESKQEWNNHSDWDKFDSFTDSESKYQKDDKYELHYLESCTEGTSSFLKKFRYMMEFVFHLHQPCYYTSLMFRNITSSSYREFFYEKSDHMTEELNKINIWDYYLTGKDGIQAFNDTGEILSIGSHLYYDPSLWMSEQANITCGIEADEQINKNNLLPFWRFKGGMPEKRYDIPVYPTTGCPWFTIANRNKLEYGIDRENKIKYYFSKGNYAATIVFRVQDKNHVYSDLYQTIVFGCFDNKKNTTIPPLYVAGGNTALIPDVWVYYPPDLHVNGLRYFLDMKNVATSNNNLIYASNFGNSNLSNFKVLGEDGVWKQIFTMQQAYIELQYWHPCDRPKIWGVPMLEPSYDMSKNRSHLHYDDRKLKHIYAKKENEVYSDKRFVKYPIDTLLNVEAHLQPYGSLVNVYMTPDEHTSGIIQTDKEEYVMLPNVWDKRNQHYLWYVGIPYWGGDCQVSEHPYVNLKEEDNESLFDKFHKYHERYNHRLLIKTGDLIELPHYDIPEEKLKELNDMEDDELLEFYIKPQVGIPTVLLFYLNSGITTEIDWGDGTSEIYSSSMTLAKNGTKVVNEPIQKTKYTFNPTHVYKDNEINTIKIKRLSGTVFENSLRIIFITCITDLGNLFFKGFVGSRFLTKFEDKFELTEEIRKTIKIRDKDVKLSDYVKFRFKKLTNIGLDDYTPIYEFTNPELTEEERKEIE